MLLSFKTLFARVQDSAYDLLLKSLLSHAVDEVSVEDAAQTSGVVFLDAREKKEFDVSHLKDAVHVGFEEFNPENLDDLPKDSRIIVYCSIGYRSEKISEKLVKAGFKNVSNLYGGIFEWVNEGNTVFDLTGNRTDKIHAYSSTWGLWLKKGEKIY